MSDVFFLIGAPRSGTTALARILGLASNAEVFIEQSPKLRFESRALLKSELPNSKDLLFQKKNSYIVKTLRKGKKYGDKNPCYLPFINGLFKNWDSKVLFLIRDGRDVLRSLMNWHHLYKPNIFSMKEDSDFSDLVLPEDDLWDYSRLRPNPGDKIFPFWKSMSRFQKIAWYWSNFNSFAIGLLSEIESSRWLIVNVSDISVERIREIYDFLGLKGFAPEIIKNMLNARINSLYDKVKKEDIYPNWANWPVQQINEFEKLAGEMMIRLGYF